MGFVKQAIYLPMELIILQNCIKQQCLGHSFPTNRVWSHSVIYKGEPISGFIQFENLFWARQKCLQNYLRATKTRVTPKQSLQNEALQNALLGSQDTGFCRQNGIPDIYS